MTLAYEKLITKAIKERIYTEEGIKKLKRKIAKEFKISTPRSEDIRNCYKRLVKENKLEPDPRLEQALILKRTRTLSGVCVVAVLTKNYPCKNNCLYCPDEKQMPKSYLSNEPAVMRAIRLEFDPYQQMKKRLEVLEYNGHDTSKVELIVMGGTFSHLPKKYQYWFVLNCFLAANGQRRVKNLSSDSLEILKKKLAQAKKKNVTAKNRIVGLTLETRPDTLDLAELKKYRELGCTRVELGVQSIYDPVLNKNKRGHDVAATVRATFLLKELGFKINYHMMPGLWGSSFKKDLKMFQELFRNEDYQPDMLKIYPCVVTKEAELFQLWQKGKYLPYSNEELKKLLVAIKKRIPPYVRITRLIRDIPTVSIEAGPDIPNLRGILKDEELKIGKQLCQCIRCREAGRMDAVGKEKLSLDRIDYPASQGQEIFLQFVSGKNKKLHSFLRLRIPASVLKKKQGKAFLPELKEAAIIREIHSYGLVAPVGKKSVPYSQKTSQHKGLGKQLIQRAEKIAKEEFGLNKLAVIAAEGVKDYYFNLGFEEKGFYLVKEI